MFEQAQTSNGQRHTSTQTQTKTKTPTTQIHQTYPALLDTGQLGPISKYPGKVKADKLAKDGLKPFFHRGLAFQSAVWELAAFTPVLLKKVGLFGKCSKEIHVLFCFVFFSFLCKATLFGADCSMVFWMLDRFTDRTTLSSSRCWKESAW